MKNLSLVVFFLVALGFCLPEVKAEDSNPYHDRMAFAVKGDVLVYVNFKFEVPIGNCGQVQVYQYERSYHSGRSAYWRLLNPGEMTDYPTGIYLFRSSQAECSPVVQISGKLIDINVYGSWTGLEIEPNDVGILSPKMKNENVFGLSEDDTQYSYNLVFNPYGYKTNLGTVMDNPNIFNMHCDSAGIIIPNQRGFLSEKILWGKSKKAQKERKKILAETVIDRDDIFVNICREKYYY